jgi:pimeloyl-ACP methyl ester carboxylesterase
MPTITTKDGVEIFYKDWGSGQPIVFSHGRPLSADDWDAQMLFFMSRGYRVIAQTGAVTAAPPRPAAAMIWTTMPTTSRR